VLQEGLFYALVGLAGPSAPAPRTGTHSGRRVEHRRRNRLVPAAAVDLPLSVRRGGRAIAVRAWIRAPIRPAPRREGAVPRIVPRLARRRIAGRPPGAAT